MTVNIRPATGRDLTDAVALLAKAELPVADLAASHLAFVAISGENLVGLIGFEPCGRDGLLRSLVVADHARESGLGRKLVAALEAAARGQGVADLWLLTIDADAWFARLGYEVRPRSEAPQSIRETAEFSSLCPGDAALMRKSLV